MSAETFIRTPAAGIRGLVIDDAPQFAAAGGTFRGPWAVVPGGRAFPVLCGEIVAQMGEDGPYTDRCGHRVGGDGEACPKHAAERDRWLAMSEADRCAWEREMDAREVWA